MVAFAFSLVVGIRLHLSEARALVVRSKVHHYFLVIAGNFFLVLLDAPLDYDVHPLISVSCLVDCLSCLMLFKDSLPEYFLALLLVQYDKKLVKAEHPF